MQFDVNVRNKYKKQADSDFNLLKIVSAFNGEPYA